jgi:hypothetical protein
VQNQGSLEGWRTDAGLSCLQIFNDADNNSISSDSFMTVKSRVPAHTMKTLRGAEVQL